MNNNEQVKKRIMFNKESDYYFIAYNLLLILDSLNCYEDKSTFNDYRKIIYIIPFITDNELLKIINLDYRLESEDIKRLEEVYINAQLREPILKSVIFTLEKKGYLTLVKNRDTIGVRLTEKAKLNKLLAYEGFKFEIENFITFKTNHKRLSTVKLDTMINRIWKSRGAIVWDI